MFTVDLLISLVTLLVFGAIGGLMLLVALNGFSERQGGVIIAVYVAIVLAGNTLVAWLANVIIRRRWFPGLRPWVAVVPAVLVTFGLLCVGPPLAVVLMKVII